MAQHGVLRQILMCAKVVTLGVWENENYVLTENTARILVLIQSSSCITCAT